MRNLLVAMLALLSCTCVHAQRKIIMPSRTMVLEGQVPPGYNKDSVKLVTFPVERITYIPDSIPTFRVPVVDGKAKWRIPGGKSVYLNSPFVGKPSIIGFHLEPGDSIHIRYKDDLPEFSGRGADRFKLVYLLGLLEDSLKATALFKGLSNEYKPLESLDDYFEWNRYLNEKLVRTLKLIDAYRPRISSFAYNVIKEKALYEIEEKRIGRFNFLIGAVQSVKDSLGRKAYVNGFGLTNQDLCNIYDSTLKGHGAHWLQYEAPLVGDPYYLWQIVKLEAYREKGMFFKNNRSDKGILGNDHADVYVASYNLAKRKFKGVIREEVLAFFFHYVRGVIHNLGFEPKIEAILADYYKQPGYPEYKKAVRRYELEQRERQLGKRSVDFTLTDTIGLPFRKEQLIGKVAVVDFWFTGCKGCVQMVPALKKVEDDFKNDTNVVFLSVSVDKNREQWLNSIAKGKYTTGRGLNLYTGGEGTNHQMIRNYGIDGYPSLLIFNAQGKVIRQYPKPDPRTDNGKALTALIKKQLVLSKDGPYVLHENGVATAYLINGRSIVNRELSKDTKGFIEVQTDEPGRSFKVYLKKELDIEPSEFDATERLIAMSDIEGNFEAFRKILQQNKVIDSAYNWTFGNGHLVLAGDMFDRGKQVTECLWLIYALEEKAKAAGGYVHFILGNHEIMNLQGNHKYTYQKYKDNATLLQKTPAELYGENSELGRWLRTKNVIEKIGDMLFIHAGISSRVNQLPLSVNDINRLARPFYGESRSNYSDEQLNVIMSETVGPFWYRGYYLGKKHIGRQIDSTLRKFSVSQIITGHTIVSDTISIHHGGRVVNIDTHHADGKSEALLIEDNKFYRIDVEGRKVPLASTWRRETNDVASYE